MNHTPAKLPGTLRDSRPLLTCARCATPSSPAGGITIGPKWICAACWKRKQFSRKQK